MTATKVRFERISKDQWELLSKNSNESVFGESVDPRSERVSFAYILLLDGSMRGFVTCQERDSESVHLQYGGIARLAQYNGVSSSCFHVLLASLAESYKRATMFVENTNVAMIRLGLSHGFYVIGIRTNKGSVLLEMGKEF